MARTLWEQTIFIIAVALAGLTSFLAFASVEVLFRPPTHLSPSLLSAPIIRDSARDAVIAWCLGSVFPVWGLLSRGWYRVIGARVGRFLYTGACGLTLLHIAVAFHVGHGWSHARAYQHVEAMSGFGSGL